MKLVLKLVGSLVLLLVLLGLGGFAWARGKSGDILERTIPTHTVDFPVPFPLDPGEVEAAGLDAAEAEALALERAVERGRRLVESRYVCVECHGDDFGGGVMVDDPMIGRLLGPNITTGEGGVTATYAPADWDRIVRHGIRPDGRPAVMPSEDFRLMADEELSDIVTYIRSLPPVDAAVPPVSLGPLGTILLATGQLPLSADLITDHDESHSRVPPEEAVTLEFGRHVAGVCTGCHKADLTGGKVPGGDPSWPAAANLTFHGEGLEGWTYEQFATAMTDAVRPDGTSLQEPMNSVTQYTRRMSDTELRALWLYLESLPAKPTGG